VHELLNGSVCFLIGRLEFGSWGVRLSGFAMEETVDDGSADALMEEHEHEGDADALVGEAVGVAVAVALD